MRRMFSTYCAGHGSAVLLGPDNIAGIVNGPRGVELHWVCWCGERGVTAFGRGDARSWAGPRGPADRRLSSEGAAS
jgi:hypothetical protein